MSSLLVREGVPEFLAGAGLSAGTRRKYAHTLGVLVERFGDGEISSLDAEALRSVLTAIDLAGGGITGQTWNRHRAALSSFLGYALRQGWTTNAVVAVERRRPVRTARGEQRRQTVPRALLEHLFTDEGWPLRERALWRLAYESAARAEEVLSLDLDKVDWADQSALVVGKGGEMRRIWWLSGARRLLVDLAGSRERGPVFLGSRRLESADPEDRCPSSGLVRLRYTRASQDFRRATEGRFTLHQLRHTRLTHLAEQGASIAMLQKVAGHRTFRGLECYLHVSDAAAERMFTAEDELR